MKHAIFVMVALTLLCAIADTIAGDFQNPNWQHGGDNPTYIKNITARMDDPARRGSLLALLPNRLECLSHTAAVRQHQLLTNGVLRYAEGCSNTFFTSVGEVVAVSDNGKWVAVKMVKFQHGRSIANVWRIWTPRNQLITLEQYDKQQGM